MYCTVQLIILYHHQIFRCKLSQHGRGGIYHFSILQAIHFKNYSFLHCSKQTITLSHGKRALDPVNEGFTPLGSKYWSEPERSERAWEWCFGYCLPVLHPRASSGMLLINGRDEHRYLVCMKSIGELRYCNMRILNNWLWTTGLFVCETFCYHIETETICKPFCRRHLKYISLNRNVYFSIMTALKCVPKGPANNIPALVQIIAWCRPGDKPISEPMIVIFEV